MVDKERDFLVVSELPQAPLRNVEGNDGKEYELMTRDEAIKEVLLIVRELKKGITG